MESDDILSFTRLRLGAYPNKWEVYLEALDGDVVRPLKPQATFRKMKMAPKISKMKWLQRKWHQNIQHPDDIFFAA